MCNSWVLSSIITIEQILALISIIVPILIILYISIDVIKGILDPKNNTDIKIIIRRIIFGMLVFLLPTIINLLMYKILNIRYKDNICYKNLSIETLKLQKQKEEDLKLLEDKKLEINRSNYLARKTRKESLLKQKERFIRDKQRTKINPRDTRTSSTFKIKTNNICIYHQTDYPNINYGGIRGASIKSHGCGTTSCAVILCTLKHDHRYNPINTMKSICAMKDACFTNGTYFPKMKQYLRSQGLNVEYHANRGTRSQYREYFKQGKMLLVHIPGHYFVIYGINNRDQLSIVEVGRPSYTKVLHNFDTINNQVTSYLLVGNKK